jgi:hypothetical protein
MIDKAIPGVVVSIKKALSDDPIRCSNRAVIPICKSGLDNMFEFGFVLSIKKNLRKIRSVQFHVNGIIMTEDRVIHHLGRPGCIAFEIIGEIGGYG